MRQNPHISSCNDYYSHANSVCGISREEVGIQEASKRAWHSTLHSASDHSGVGSGYSGGLGWNRLRDFNSQQYGPGASCIDTLLPIDVVATFLSNAQGQLTQHPDAPCATLGPTAAAAPTTCQVGFKMK